MKWKQKQTSKKRITVDDVLQFAFYNNENYNLVALFCNTATGSTVTAAQFLPYMQYYFGGYFLNAETLNRTTFDTVTYDNFTEFFSECFGTGDIFSPDIARYKIYLSEIGDKSITENITRDKETEKTKNTENSGAITTTADNTKTTTPTGTQTKSTSATLSETIETSLGSWNDNNYEGAEKVVTTGTPTTSETITDGKIITERLTGNLSTATDTRQTETNETGTDGETISRTKSENGGLVNAHFEKSVCAEFCRRFVYLFCETSYTIS